MLVRITDETIRIKHILGIELVHFYLSTLRQKTVASLL